MERVAAATAASPQAATAAKTPSADTATQIAAGASTRNGADTPGDVLGTQQPQGHQDGHRGRAADHGQGQGAGEGAAQADRDQPDEQQERAGRVAGDVRRPAAL